MGGGGGSGHGWCGVMGGWVIGGWWCNGWVAVGGVLIRGLFGIEEGG